MDTTTLIYLGAAFLVGTIVAWLFVSQKKGKYADTDYEKLQQENEQLKAYATMADKEIVKKDEEVEVQHKALLDEWQNKLEEAKQKVKAEYELLLKDAHDKLAKAEKHLQHSLEMGDAVSTGEESAVIEALKKKIKSLEDDLEDAEDDLDTAKKKLRSKETDFSELQETYERVQKEASQLHDDLRHANDALEEQTERVDLLAGSLDFMEEILTAPEDNTHDVKHLNNNIDEVCAFVEQLMECYATIMEHIPFDYQEYKQTWLQRTIEWSSVARKTWLNGKTTLAFIGEFSAGKTSIVNRILSQDDPSIPQLPVSTKATTAIPTYIAGGQQVEYRFVTPDERLKIISQQAFTEKVSKEVLDQVKGVSSLIKYFVMKYKNPNLKGLSILDTPGFNSNDEEDAQRTMEVINECDALFWVFDVNAGTVNRSSISIIKEHLNNPLYVVINKVDTKAETEVKKVEDLIQKTLADEGIAVKRFIRFSAKAPLSDIVEPIKSIAHNAQKDDFLENLAKNIESTLKGLEKRIKKAQGEFDQIKMEGETIDATVYDRLVLLQANCEEAVKIPQWETHFWTRDCYEMSQEDFAKLSGYLETSYNMAAELDELYNHKATTLTEGQKAYDHLQSYKQAWQRVEEMRLQFEKIRKKF